MKKEKIVYTVDDSFKIPEEIQNMSEEEMDRQIAILEAKGREEGKSIPRPILTVKINDIDRQEV